MLRDSGLLEELGRYAFAPDGRPMCIYDDPAYLLRNHLQSPFRNGILTPQMRLFNSSMSAVRVSVEWLFADVVNYFKFVDYKKNIKLQLSSLGKMYIICVLFRNALTCLYGNITTRFFSLEPPANLFIFYSKVNKMK